MCHPSIKESRDTASSPGHQVWRQQLGQQKNQRKEEGQARDPEIDASLVQDVPEREFSSHSELRRIVERTKFFDEGARLTISLGVAATPEDSQTPAGLVQADGALYRAKSVGRNQVRAA